MRKLQCSAALLCVVASPSFAAQTIEAIGGEKCAKRTKTYSVSFLAPEDASVEVRGKGLLGDGEEVPAETIRLSLDGKPCPREERCTVSARKGQTYKLVAESTKFKVDALCISVSRP